jgi:HrpA-like RNA helicase
MVMKFYQHHIKYSRVVIIATNVAEASITIENLRYVVEMGYFNFVGYN